MLISNGMVQASVPFFGGENFRRWKVQMEVFLEYQDVRGVLEEGIPTLTEDPTESQLQEFQEAQKKDRKALYFIHQGVGEVIFERIVEVKTAKEAWDTLARIYEPEEVQIPIPEPCLPSDGPDSIVNGETRDKYLKQCVTMHRAAITGDWKAAQAVISEFPGIVRTAITSREETPLHIAVTAKQKSFVKKLLEKMEPEDLEIENRLKGTAFNEAVASGVKELAEVMLGKNPALLRKSQFFIEFMSGKREMMLYLNDKLRMEKESPFELGEYFVSLVICGFYDFALKTFRLYKSLALSTLENPDGQEWTAMDWLARRPSAIARESRLGVFERSINFCCKSLFHDALMATCARQLADEIWKEIIESPQNILNFMKKSPNMLFYAVESGNVELLKIILGSYPELIRHIDSKGRNLFQVAVINRQDSVFNMLCELGAVKDFVAQILRDGTNSSILHLVANLPPSERLHVVSGAALQMQRELIWFEAIKNIAPEIMRELRNADGYLPEELFTRHHKELRKEGEEWMKSTAQSCMIVATLVATVVFAAAFTVPGGNNQDTGIPIFKRDEWFNIFAVSDAIALSTSSLAIVFFLSILTSRYAESDFRRSLPFRLMCGLLALAVSISAMVVAFSATFFLVYKQKISWIPIFNISLSLLSTALFLLLHGKLLFDTTSSTIRSNYLFREHGSKLFPRKHPSLLCRVLRSRFWSIWPRRKINLS